MKIATGNRKSRLFYAASSRVEADVIMFVYIYVPLSILVFLLKAGST